MVWYDSFTLLVVTAPDKEEACRLVAEDKRCSPAELSVIEVPLDKAGIHADYGTI